MPEPPATARRVRVEQVMGTAVGVDLRDPGVPEAALDGFFDWLRQVDARFSTYRAGSEISRIGRGELAPGAAHPDVREVLQICEEVRRCSGGLFAAWRPDGGLDPSAVVKGWSVDRGAHILDPRSGLPALGLLSLTVVGPSLTLADAYSTAAFVMGGDGASWIAGIPGYEAFAVTAEHRAVWTEGCRSLRVQDMGA